MQLGLWLGLGVRVRISNGLTWGRVRIMVRISTRYHHHVVQVVHLPRSNCRATEPNTAQLTTCRTRAPDTTDPEVVLLPMLGAATLPLLLPPPTLPPTLVPTLPPSVASAAAPPAAAASPPVPTSASALAASASLLSAPLPSASLSYKMISGTYVCRYSVIIVKILIFFSTESRHRRNIREPWLVLSTLVGEFSSRFFNSGILKDHLRLNFA